MTSTALLQSRSRARTCRDQRTSTDLPHPAPLWPARQRSSLDKSPGFGGLMRWPSRAWDRRRVAPRDDEKMPRWIHSYWDEEDVTFYWEVGDDGWVTRHVEVAGPGRSPRAAASLDEWMRELEAGSVQEYQAKYGFLADQPVTEWDADFPHEDLTQEQYEEVWLAARRFLERDE